MRTLFTLAIFTFILATVPVFAYAAIDVDFESTPLFGISNFLPGDTVSKTVSVKNTGDTTQDVYTELLNVVNGGLASQMSVVITGGAPFSGSFTDFDNAGKLFLSTLPAGNTIVYTFKMSFAHAAGNPYQRKSLGFDLCLGFSGGQFECDDAGTNGYSQGSYGGYSQGSYGGGGYSQGSYGSGSYSQGSYDPGGGNNGPVPQVLGEQVSVIPTGAPNTGLGGSPAFNGIIALLFSSLFALLLYIRRKLHVR